MPSMITRSLVTVALGGLLSLTTVQVASADTCPEGTYPPGVQCTPVASTVTSTPPDAPFTYRVGGFKPYSSVHLVLHSTPIDLGTVIADGGGFATFEVRIPGFVPSGEHTLTVSGINPDGSTRILVSALTVTSPIAVTQPAGLTTGTTGSSAGTGTSAVSSVVAARPITATSGNIPFTGFELGAGSLLGIGLLGAGTLAVVTSRRTRSKR